MADQRAQVGIIGAGPAGLVLARRLSLAGIDTVVLEARSRDYVEARVRAGVLEAPTVELLDDLGVAGRLHREGLVHRGVVLQWKGERHRIDFEELTGRAVTVYGQQEVVKDLIAARLDDGGSILFGATVEAIDGLCGDTPVIRYRTEEGPGTLRCDVVAGCDGFHGLCRTCVPAEQARVWDRRYPYAWLGILAAVAPSTDELIYAHHERGFAMHSMRSSSVSRLYLQVDPDDSLANWPHERIWAELQRRLGIPGWHLQEGPILEAGITPMRSFVHAPMRHGRLFLAGDAAHIVPPTGAKGMNLAIADVKVLADSLERWFSTGADDGLEAYEARCAQRVWRVQDFSTMMTTLLHVDPAGDPFETQLQAARQDRIVTSRATATALAEMYVGLPLPN
jgi:p-hydroxybenzoate 3-monooxygenase